MTKIMTEALVSWLVLLTAKPKVVDSIPTQDNITEQSTLPRIGKLRSYQILAPVIKIDNSNNGIFGLKRKIL